MVLNSHQVHRGNLSELKSSLEEMMSKITTNNKLNSNNTKKQENNYIPFKTNKIEITNEENDHRDSQNGNNDENTVSSVLPPKPLPRRAGSISEGSDEAMLPRPVARPRTTTTPVVTSVNPSNYKV